MKICSRKDGRDTQNVLVGKLKTGVEKCVPRRRTSQDYLRSQIIFHVTTAPHSCTSSGIHAPMDMQPRQNIMQPFALLSSLLYALLFPHEGANKGRICREAKLRRRQNLTPVPFPPPFTCLFVRFVKLLAHYESVCVRLVD